MRQRITHLFAILALAVGVYGIFNEVFATKPEADNITQVEPQETKLRIWVANQSIRKGDNFDPEQLDAQMRLESEVGYALLDLPYSKGAVFRHGIRAGEVLTADDLITPEDPDYVETIIKPGMVPYPLAMASRHIVAAGVKAGDYIDILSLTSLQQNMAQRDSLESPRAANVDVKPLLNRVRVLAVQGKTYDDQELSHYSVDETSTLVTLVLEIPHDFISRMTLARRLSALEIYKSRNQTQLPQAQTKDILPGYQGIVELRGSRRG
ncbi:Flp pilus assembly protein CpaB [Vibrio sp. SCSIO 43136]|uniref:Flp pilus assembly protein CpaB n=1 Tax=Vibrio sp. SCSIO 43136 TaxID=2819101 RepID=UPI002074E201|nr:Flp pilus assembly protein CpaB [Vibrio sp. SCSIO 43136]USD67755.1 Flp pilus assembly protein CpaB [Vibrio sp. SCSIO 43136]